MKKNKVLSLSLLLSSLMFSGQVLSEEQYYPGNSYSSINSEEDSPVVGKLGLLTVHKPNNTTSLCTAAIIGPRHVLATYRCLTIHDSMNSFKEYWEASKKGTKSVFSNPKDVFFSKSLLSFGGDHQMFVAKKIHYLENPGVVDADDNDTMGFGSVIVEFEKEISKDFFTIMSTDEFRKYREGSLYIYGYKQETDGTVGLVVDSIKYKKNIPLFDNFSEGNKTLDVLTMADAFSSLLVIEGENGPALLGIQLGKMRETGIQLDKLDNPFPTVEKPYFRFMYPIFINWMNSIVKNQGRGRL